MLNANTREQIQHNLINLSKQKQSLLICLSWIFFINNICSALFVHLQVMIYRCLRCFTGEMFITKVLLFFFYYMHYMCEILLCPPSACRGGSALQSMFTLPQIWEEEKGKGGLQRYSTSSWVILANTKNRFPSFYVTHMWFVWNKNPFM